MKRLLFILIFPLLSVVSCFPYTREDEQVNSSFQGKYVGAFSGVYNGDINFDINKRGDIRGEITFRESILKESVYGFVNIKGKFDMNTKTYFTMSGLIMDKTKGKWIKGNETGEFYFYKIMK